LDELPGIDDQEAPSIKIAVLLVLLLSLQMNLMPLPSLKQGRREGITSVSEEGKEDETTANYSKTGCLEHEITKIENCVGIDHPQEQLCDRQD
jgi:hypothetical protein